jgi:hypothetical protein
MPSGLPLIPRRDGVEGPTPNVAEGNVSPIAIMEVFVFVRRKAERYERELDISADLYAFANVGKLKCRAAYRPVW